MDLHMDRDSSAAKLRRYRSARADSGLSLPFYQPPSPSHPPPGYSAPVIRQQNTEAVVQEARQPQSAWDASFGAPGVQQQQQQQQHKPPCHPSMHEQRTAAVVLSEVEKACRQLDVSKDGRVPMSELRSALSVIAARESRDARSRKLVAGVVVKPSSATRYAMDGEHRRADQPVHSPAIMRRAALGTALAQRVR